MKNRTLSWKRQVALGSSFVGGLAVLAVWYLCDNFLGGCVVGWASQHIALQFERWHAKDLEESMDAVEAERTFGRLYARNLEASISRLEDEAARKAW